MIVGLMRHATLFTVFVLYASATLASASITLVSPKDGEVVPPSFSVAFAVQGITISPVEGNAPNSGHAYLLVDVYSLADFSSPLAVSAHIRRLRDGQQPYKLTLPTGKHTLQLLLTDRLHVPHPIPVLSEKITVFVR